MPLAQTTLRDASPNPAMPPSNHARRSSWLSYLIIAMICLVVLVPAIFAGLIPAERPRWIEARALEAQLNGEYDEALSAIDELITVDPSRARLFQLWQLQTLNQSGKYREAIVAGEQLINDHPGPWDETRATKPARQPNQASPDAASDPENPSSQEAAPSPAESDAPSTATKDRNEQVVVLGIDDFPHYQELSIAYQAVGDFEQALDVLLRCEQFGLQERDDRTINNLAYARSLAGKGTRLALAKMNQIIGSEYNEATLFHMSAYQHSMLLREGEREFLEDPGLRRRVLALALDDFAAAIQARTRIVEEAIRLTDEAKKYETKSQEGKADDDEANPSPPGAKTATQDSDNQDTKAAAKSEKETEREVPNDLIGRNRRELALVIAHRAKLFESVGDQENADSDWDRVRELGFSPQALSLQELDLNESGRRVGSLAQWLDTRGYLEFRLKNYLAARNDFEIAIRLMESYISLQRWYRVNSAEKSPDIRSETLRVRGAERSLAAMLYHVWEVEQELGDQELAEKCRERIESLGFELGPQLH